ncbi:glutaminase A [Pacificimonas flava]|uniref:Glutaminase n=2 Tax=Pacificimonas TaxID=1960290 RepID=A0A219B998_9SPHN|nr:MULTISPECIES: glutaminase A [Pacificimonas]MBZ6379813.1 glutaminase A [Pacificimonas aurantium]OWV34348.1 glutaminase A [Pacificimonas flava]
MTEFPASEAVQAGTADLAGLYRSVFRDGGEPPRPWDVLASLREAGLKEGDPRLRATFANFGSADPGEALSLKRFGDLVAAEEVSLFQRALAGRLSVPDFVGFGDEVRALFEDARDYRGGEVATYIPQLARVDPEHYALGLCTVDGQRLSLGDDRQSYCVQSTCKPINYALARDLFGREKVHAHVGREPSGRSFNELTLNPLGLPHNPMINAGAIMCASLIRPEAPLADRFDFVMQKWRDLGGGEPAAFDNAVYLSEKATADRNFALAYFMRENNAFPDDTDLAETLDFYFQCCSITVNVQQMSVVAATLANGGICPVTSRRVLKAETVKDCLSLMYSCGMYDFSGEFAFAVGMPAKSGVSGALMLVVPGVCGFAVWSPRLDRCGNSVRGVQFAQTLVRKFAFHSYANMVEDQSLVDPTVSRVVRSCDAAGYLCAAAAQGDVSELRRLIAAGTDVSRSDYDGRTALHLAASEGQLEAARLLISAGCPRTPRDRWGNTPLDDAKREGRRAMVDLLTPSANARDAKRAGHENRRAKAA